LRQKVKILEVVNVDFSLVHFLLPLMRALRARGHEVIGVCAEGRLLDGPRAEGFRIETPPLARSLNPAAQRRAHAALRDLIRREKPDLVHGHGPIAGLLARVAAHSAGVPRIATTCHGFLFNQPGPWWRRSLALTLERATGRLAHTYITVSEKEAADARRLGIHPRAVAVLNGRDPAQFRPDPATRAALRTEFGATESDCVILFVGRLVADKGLRELLAAMDSTPENAVFWIAGERLSSDRGEDLEPHFARAAARLGRRLVRLGYRTDVARVMAAADVFCLPSYTEAMPMTAIEAMHVGLPVVGSAVGGLLEQVVEGETGLLVPRRESVPLAAALSRLAADPLLRARMGAAGRARAAERFDETTNLARTVALLEG
jgi:glycosyltransferase involved in cell wall biosynthesis